MNMMTPSFLTIQRSVLDAQINAFETLFDGLSPAEMAWQFVAGKWSIVQCVEHLNISLAHYVKEMNKEIALAVKAGQLPNEAFQSGFWGKRMPKMFEPKPDGKIKWKMKTIKQFQPNVAAEDQAATVAAFFALMEDLQNTCEAARAVDLGKVRVISTLGKMLRFKLGDCFKFVIAHNARHLLQAQRVRQAMESASVST